MTLGNWNYKFDRLINQFAGMAKENQGMKVLVTSDGSPASLDAVREYCRLSANEPHDITVLTVDDVQPYGVLNRKMRQQVESLQKQVAMETFSAVEKVLRQSGRSGEHIELSGHAANEIVGWTESHPVDLLVIGARGANFISRLLLGSTSDSVVSHSHCPVLVVRPANHPDGVEQPPHVTLAWDGSENSKMALEYLKTWRLTPDARISILSVLPRPKDLPEDIVYDAEHVDAQKSEIEGQAEELRQIYKNVDVHVVEAVSVASAIIGFSDRNNSSLVVIGDKGRSAIQRILIGSVARHVLHSANCSVLMVKAPQVTKALQNK